MPSGVSLLVTGVRPVGLVLILVRGREVVLTTLLGRVVVTTLLGRVVLLTFLGRVVVVAALDGRRVTTTWRGVRGTTTVLVRDVLAVIENILFKMLRKKRIFKTVIDCTSLYL